MATRTLRPEETDATHDRAADANRLRAAARVRIIARRQTSSVQHLFDLADHPTTRIRISKAALEEILAESVDDVN